MPTHVNAHFYRDLGSVQFDNPETTASLKRNIKAFCKLLFFVIRKARDECESYPTPLSSEQIDAAKDILETYESETDVEEGKEGKAVVTTTQIHRLAYSIVSQENAPSASEMPFGSVVERFLILYARRPNGTGWVEIKNYTSSLSFLTWSFRAVVVTDAYLHREDYDNSSNG